MTVRKGLAAVAAVAAVAVAGLVAVALYGSGDTTPGGNQAAGTPGGGEPATDAAPGSPAAPATPEAGTAAIAERNLLSDDQHAFEGSIEGWTPQGNTTLEHDTGVAFVGAGSLAVTVDDGGPWPDDTRTARAGTSMAPDAVPVEAGARYRASWRILAEEAVPARCELRWFAEGGNILATFEGETVTTEPGSWTPAECAGTAPRGARSASVRVHLSEVDFGATFNVDDAWLVETAPAALGGEPPSGDGTGGGDTGGEDDRGGDAAGHERVGVHEVVQGSGDDPRHGEDVGAGNTGPTAYYDEELGRRLTYDDLEPSGSVTTTHDGQVIERLDVSGAIVIAHDDVVIRALRVRNQGGGRYSISYDANSEASGAELSYVEVDGGEDPDNIGIYLDHFTLRHAHVFGQATGVMFGGGSTIEYSYVHSQALKPGSHNAAMAMHGGSGVVLRNNNLVGSTSSALSLYPRLAPLVDITVEGNLFNGGSYCAYAGGGQKEYAGDSRKIRWVGNKFGTDMHAECGHYGPVTNIPDGTGTVWRDNVWQATGEPVG